MDFSKFPLDEIDLYRIRKSREEEKDKQKGSAQPPTLPKQQSFVHSHVPKNILLVLISLAIIPFSATIVLFSLIFSRFQAAWKRIPRRAHLSSRNELPPQERKTILVTGVSMAKGLTIARVLSRNTPHRIIGADISFFSPGRFSKSVSKYYVIKTSKREDSESYIDSLLFIIRNEGVDLWISCSSVGAAVEDGEVVRLAEEQIGPRFKAIQFRDDVVEKFHDKDKFITYIQSLGLRVPESHRCTSADQAFDVLLKNYEWPADPLKKSKEERKYIMKSIGVDDKARNSMATLLPFDSTLRKTRAYVKELGVSETNPFQLQQYIRGKEYCTHALIIHGQVKAFVACPSSELLMHYEPLSPESQLSREMLAFTEKVAEDCGSSFTGHLSFDFMIEQHGEEIKLYPIESNPRAHTAIILFSNTPDMASAYLSVFEPSTSQLYSPNPVVPKQPIKSYYWIGHEIIMLAAIPLLSLLQGQASFQDVRKKLQTMSYHILHWRDGTFAIWDPVPFFVLYHVYWPITFLRCLVSGKAWSRINVSTTKMFEI